MPGKELSIIIPTFNSEKTLSDSLDSVINQTYAQKEIWIIDGLSTDSTIEIVKEYQIKFPFIHFTSEKDNGIYDAMNKGIDLAVGEWIYFLGSDDTLFDKKVLERVFQNESIVKTADFVYGEVLWGDTGSLYDGPFDIIKLYRTNICHQAIFYKKDLFLKLGKFDLEYPMLADWKFNSLCFFDHSVTKAYLNKIIARFSLQGSSGIVDDPFYANKKAFYYQRLNNLTLFERTKFKIRYCDRSNFKGKINLAFFLIIFLIIYPLHFYKNKDWNRF